MRTEFRFDADAPAGERFSIAAGGRRKPATEWAATQVFRNAPDGPGGEMCGGSQGADDGAEGRGR